MGLMLPFTLKYFTLNSPSQVQTLCTGFAGRYNLATSVDGQAEDRWIGRYILPFELQQALLRRVKVVQTLFF